MYLCAGDSHANAIRAGQYSQDHWQDRGVPVFERHSIHLKAWCGHLQKPSLLVFLFFSLPTAQPSFTPGPGAGIHIRRGRGRPGNGRTASNHTPADTDSHGPSTHWTRDSETCLQATRRVLQLGTRWVPCQPARHNIRCPQCHHGRPRGGPCRLCDGEKGEAALS